MSDLIELPKYRDSSGVEVLAGLIDTFSRADHEVPDILLHEVDQPVRLDGDFFRKYQPQKFDYLIMDHLGNLSAMPAEAFEQTYTRVDE